ncbi:MAG TPA: radical SAM protein [Planctomycetaceae bacterium]|nr:radical SAM protein [Planctomycetaceae bacterium]
MRSAVQGGQAGLDNGTHELHVQDSMATQIDAKPESLSHWVWATDGHASHRAPLLDRAAAILDGRLTASAGQREELAARLERWRYQHLNERAGQMAPQDWELADWLDLAANELTRRPARPPRRPRMAIAGQGETPTAAIDAALQGLDPNVPLDELREKARALTEQHFTRPSREGQPKRRVLLYAPLYLSSYCVNHCTYCGFRYPHPIQRKHLGPQQALREADLLFQRGFRHLLLVAGDFPKLLTTDYYVAILQALCDRGVKPAIEIAPQSTASYARMIEAGACGITLYQETYDEGLYRSCHPRGSKMSYDWRLEGVERAAEVGMRRLGLGILLGLADPRQDLLALMRHGEYLRRRFPDRTLAFSLPRIYEAPQGFKPPYQVDDETFVRLYCVLRIAFPQAELVLSTREPAALRNQLAAICITQMSAGSCTVPGGYGDASPESRSGQQFPVADHRPPAEVAAWLARAGLQPIWQIDQST